MNTNIVSTKNKVKRSAPVKLEVVVFDNGGTDNGGTMDRYTIVGTDGEVYGCNSEPFHGIGQYVGHVIEMMVERWKVEPGLRGKESKWIPKAVRKYRREFIEKAENDPDWIGAKVEDVSALPDEVLKFIKQVEAN